MKICVLGAGYVGLVSAVCLSDFGHEVWCIDPNAAKIEVLQAGHVPIYEPGLEDILARNVDAGRLSFATAAHGEIAQADAIFIAVGTPARRGDGAADLTFVYEATQAVVPLMKAGAALVIKSTVPVGTNETVNGIALDLRASDPIDVVSNPEFLREGSAIEDFMRPDRIVAGCRTEAAAEVVREIYRPLYLRDFPILITDPASAEMTKYASNAFLATKISFINEISQLCDETGADVRAVAKGMGLDKRIGHQFLHAGPGYGGSCFPKDTSALASLAAEFGMSLHIVDAAMRVNDVQAQVSTGKIMQVLGQNPRGARVAVLGVTFKPETDDMREAPALRILPHLAAKGVELTLCDPQGYREGESLLPPATWNEDPYEACKGADAVVLLTEWNAFRALDLEKLAKAMRNPRMIDLRNIYSADAARAAGFDTYRSTGREWY